jgi:hypothetical protein
MEKNSRAALCRANAQRANDTCFQAGLGFRAAAFQFAAVLRRRANNIWMQINHNIAQTVAIKCPCGDISFHFFIHA